MPWAGYQQVIHYQTRQGNFAIRDVVIDPFAGEQIILAGSIRFDIIDNSILRQLSDDIVAFGILPMEKRPGIAAAAGNAQPWPFAIFPAEPESASTDSGFALCGYSRRLHLARVIGWINVSYPEWPLRLNLNDGGTAYPTVVVHFGRCFDVSARR